MQRGAITKEPLTKTPSLSSSQLAKSIEGPIAKPDAKIAHQTSPLDRPLNIKDSLKLLSDVIALSTYFLADKSPTGESILLANKLMVTVLSLGKDFEEEKDLVKKDNIADGFVSMAKADLFPHEKLNLNDRVNLAKFGFIEPKKKGETVPYFLKKQDIDDYISHHVKDVKEDYKKTLYQLVDRTCQFCIMGFASYTLLKARRDYDKELIAKGQTRITPHDAKDMISSEKNKIVKLVAELASKKTKSTKAGEIAKLEIEIAGAATHIRDQFDRIEEKLLENTIASQEKQIEILSSGILSAKVLQGNGLLASVPGQQIAKHQVKLAAEKQNSSKDLLNTIAAIEEKNAVVLAENLSLQQLLKKRALAAEKHLEDSQQQHILEMKLAEEAFGNQKATLEREKEILTNQNLGLQKQLQQLDITNTKLNQENFLLKLQFNKQTTRHWWKTALAVSGIVVGTLLCVTLIGAFFGIPLIRKSFNYYSTPSDDRPPLDLRDDFHPEPIILPSSPHKTIASSASITPSNVTNSERKISEGHVADVSVFKKTKTPPPLLSQHNQGYSTIKAHNSKK